VSPLALPFGIRGVLMIRSGRQTHGDVWTEEPKDPIELLHGALLAGLCFVSSDVGQQARFSLDFPLMRGALLRLTARPGMPNIVPAR
jgi:hypothetical protein